MERITVTYEHAFFIALSGNICGVCYEGERHIVQDAEIGIGKSGEPVFIVTTLRGILSFENCITLFLFDSPREAQQFLNFERCEFDEDKILNSEFLS